MDITHHQWPQEIVVKPMEEIVVPMTYTTTSSSSNSKSNNGNSNNSNSSTILEKKMRPREKAHASNCPRCNSTNTKFCYYNNYSLSQPRYFCKTCRRYWTEGGSLRNIPVGGGSRKNNKKPYSSSSNSNYNSNSSSSKKLPNLSSLPQIPTNNTSDENPNPKVHDFPITHDFKTISQLIQVPDFENDKSHNDLSALELLTGVSNSFIPIMPMYSSGFPSLPTLSFSFDGIGNSNIGYEGILQGVEESGNNRARVLFPFEDLSNTNDDHQHNMEHHRDHQQGDSTGYWNGVLESGSW